MITTSMIYELLKSKIDPAYLSNAELTMTLNPKNYDRLSVCAKPTLFNSKETSQLFARVKTSGKSPYISFRGIFSIDFKNIGFTDFIISKSDGYLKIDPELFYLNFFDYAKSVDLMNDIFLASCNFPTFGCCDKYERCSDELRCLHEDQLYAAAACQYRKNLYAGKIFYGKNRTNK